MISLHLAITIVQLIICVILVAIVMLQSGKSAGLSGAIAGGADTFMSKNKAKSLDSKLAKATKWVAAVFVILTLVLNIISK
ncbi:MAG: preprotein translocase subunit SecG [Oscillospiraceae bacterium]|nr:preprotein translocase subunit SecG [Oscillospiraceae bacterium]